MGIFTPWREIRAARELQAVAASHYAGGSGSLPIASPWSSGELSKIIAADVFGAGFSAASRPGAMRLPALFRGRNLLVSTICRLPLRTLDGLQLTANQPRWLTNCGDGSSPQLRAAWTVDDLMFYGCSLWWFDYESTAADAEPVAAHRVAIDEWTLTEDLEIEINGRPAPARNAKLIPGLHEGLLVHGAETLQDVTDLYAAVRQRIQNPVPQLNLHQTGGTPLTNDEIDALIDRWAAARRGLNGGVSYTNSVIELDEVGVADPALMIEARNAAAVDLARLVGVHAGMVDATAPKASLNYETATGRNQELVDFDLYLYLTPISARLSLDDVTPAGTRVDFDLSDLTGPVPSPVGPNLED